MKNHWRGGADLGDFQRRNRILVCTVASYPASSGPGGLPVGVWVMLRSAAKAGIEVTLLGTNRPWRNFFTNKIIHLQADLAPLAEEYETILMVDANDVVFVRDLEAIMDAARGWDRPTFNAERTCYPDPDLAQHYPPCPTSFKYLNAGCLIGRLSDYLTELQRMASLVTPDDYRGDDEALWGDDQLLWSQYYVEGERIAIDNQCRVFQCLHSVHDHFLQDGVNEETGTRPCIYHANGMNQCSIHYQRHC